MFCRKIFGGEVTVLTVHSPPHQKFVSQLKFNSFIWLYFFPSYRYPFQPNQTVALHDWEIFLKDTAKMIVQEQSPQKLLQIRNRLYELTIHGIPSEFIFKVRFLVLFVCFCFSNWFLNRNTQSLCFTP